MSALDWLLMLWPLWLALGGAAVAAVGERRLRALLDEADA